MTSDESIHHYFEELVRLLREDYEEQTEADFKQYLFNQFVEVYRSLKDDEDEDEDDDEDKNKDDDDDSSTETENDNGDNQPDQLDKCPPSPKNHISENVDGPLICQECFHHCGSTARPGIYIQSRGPYCPSCRQIIKSKLTTCVNCGGHIEESEFQSHDGIIQLLCSACYSTHNEVVPCNNTLKQKLVFLEPTKLFATELLQKFTEVCELDAHGEKIFLTITQEIIKKYLTSVSIDSKKIVDQIVTEIIHELSKLFELDTQCNETIRAILIEIIEKQHEKWPLIP